MIKTLRLLTALLLLANIAFGQSSSSGEIYGRVTDDAGKPLDFATVRALEGGIVKGGGKTDENGNFKIKPLAPGKYTVTVSYAGYVGEELQGVQVGSDKRQEVNFKLEKKTATTKKDVVIKTFKRKLIDPGNPGGKGMTKQEIKEAATISTGDFAAMQGGMYQRKAGDAAVNAGGDRASGTQYMIDGILVGSGRNVNFPPGAIDQLEVMSNGLSAKYGNATGAIISVTTNGVSKELSGSLQMQRSIEGYNNNLVSLDLAGPLLSMKRKGVKKPVLGFSLVLSGTYDKDPNPFIDRYTIVKPEVLKSLQERPLIANPNGTGNFVYASNMLTADDFTTVKARQNGQTSGLNYLGKIEVQPTDNISITLGSNIVYNRIRAFSFFNSLFSPEANNLTNDYSARGFVRLTQRLGKSSLSDKKESKKQAINNAYYSLQFSYQKDYQSSENPDHLRNIFDYNYVGKFVSHRSPFYIQDTARGGYSGFKFLGETIDSVTFTPGGKNPILEKYTTAVYNDDRFFVNNLTTLQNLNGMRNGDAPLSTYGLWSGVGSAQSFYSFANNDRIQLNLDASFDIEQGVKRADRKDPITHNIQFGLGYDQRTNRSYTLRGLWPLMRLVTNRQIQNLDQSNPRFVIGGQEYSYEDLQNGVATMTPFDTIKYNRLYVANDHSRFDKELRNYLYGNIYDQRLIDVDALDPKTFKLEWFSADDLYNGGQDLVFYNGYDYLGNRLKKQPSFNDFWTKKDARGDNLRPIGAFRPIYMFGYILDKFSYKDLNFNIGLRVDRYDANQKTLKDPYSLYAVRKNGDLKSGQFTTVSGAPLPTALDKEMVPYVDNNQSPQPRVVGYRKGDVWFDPFGKEIADPTILSGLYANGLPIQPFLQNKNDSIKSSSFNPNNSFEDYRPDLKLSPRIQFSFPISTNALFYGNYDVIWQSPSGNNFVTPDDYYFLAERQATINNANMRMEKGINYTLGYQQKLSELAALTLEAYYRERKDQVQIQRYLLAYPITYESFGNRDFSSTKGLTVKLDFRRSGPIRMNIDYTLQFAEGTGSNTTSTRSLLSTGQPNLRTVFPLDFDSRHIINAVIDYRYSDAYNQKGPEIGGVYPFRNTGINLILRTRSGEPYTRAALSNPIVGGDFQSTPIVGTINGSRLPWLFEVNTRIDKDITLGYIGRKKDSEGKVIKEGRRSILNLYTYVTNLLNTRNTLGVYRYTGTGDDDGYLASDQATQDISRLQFQQAFRDQYAVRIFAPGNFNNPRRIFLGLTLAF